ncbi:MAG: hypothetical protein Kow0099_23090 [Candidatus Abyssubacteria bacterium]
MGEGWGKRGKGEREGGKQAHPQIAQIGALIYRGNDRKQLFSAKMHTDYTGLPGLGVTVERMRCGLVEQAGD